eukprot:s2189_g13.t1
MTGEQQFSFFSCFSCITWRNTGRSSSSFGKRGACEDRIRSLCPTGSKPLREDFGGCAEVRLHGFRHDRKHQGVGQAEEGTDESGEGAEAGGPEHAAGHGAELDTAVATVGFEDLSANAFRVTISGKYELLRSISVQEWDVELRKRLQGKAKGQLYKVFKRKKDQKPFYTMSLGSGWERCDHSYKYL